MKTVTAIGMFLAASMCGAQTTNYTQVVHIHTSLNHLTVVELGEPVTTLAVANPDAFSVERHGDKVLLKPVRPSEATNIFIWTPTRQLSYELDSAGDVSEMNVLIRNLPTGTIQTPAPSLAGASGEADKQRIAGSAVSAAIAGSEEITQENGRVPSGQVSVKLDQVYRTQYTTFVRYTLTNKTSQPFRVASPSIQILNPTERPVSLRGLRNHQLAPATVSKFKAQPASSIAVVEESSSSRDIEPGAEVTGVIGFHGTVAEDPRLFSLHFGETAGAPVADAVL